jgi:hypothetical protein
VVTKRSAKTREPLSGQYLGISNDIMIVGTSFIDSSKGAVFVFERNRGGAENWGQVARLTASDRATGDAFGAASIYGNTIVHRSTFFV